MNNIIEIIENSIYLDCELHEPHQNNTDNDYVSLNHKLYALGENESGTVALYKVTVEDIFQSKTEPNNYRFHNIRYVKKIEKVVDDISGSSETHNEDQPYTAKDGSTTTYSVADLFGFVKQYDEKFSPKPVTLQKIEADLMAPPLPPKETTISTPPASVYSIADIIKNVNSIDKHFLKYIPDELLSETQIKAKRRALKEYSRSE